MNRLGIEMLTLLGMNPVEHVRLAGELGCASISTGLVGLPLAAFGYPRLEFYAEWSLEDDPALRREMKAAMRESGVHIALAEGFRIRPDGDVHDRGAGLDIMAELGAKRVNTVSMEPDVARTHDQLAILADMVIARGMRLLVEFAPPNAISSLPQALAAAAHVGVGRCQLTLDAMHFFRSGATPEDIAALDPGLVGYAQLCDAPLCSPGSTYMQEAMFARQVPGTGELPVQAFIAALPGDLAIGIEVPMIAAFQSGVSPREHAARVVAAARELGA